LPKLLSLLLGLVQIFFENSWRYSQLKIFFFLQLFDSPCRDSLDSEAQQGELQTQDHRTYIACYPLIYDLFQFSDLTFELYASELGKERKQ
jgi:hypothetical protein